jgi:hypothetical protein
MSISQEIVKTLFDYREDGVLIRKTKVGGRSGDIGRPVGFVLKDAKRPGKMYMATKISGQHFCIHRLIWVWHHGDWPEQLDHIDRNTLNNKIENLRSASASKNMMNRKTFKNNKSGYRGVSWHKTQKKWFAYVDADKKRKNLGYFDSLEEAANVANEARKTFHGQFLALR